MTDTSFQIRAEWPSKPAAGARDVANLSIKLGSMTLTQLADLETNTLRDYLRASAVTLALWFGDNWWRLRWESRQDDRQPSPDWRLRHELTSASGGTVWPPIMIYGTGDKVVVGPAYGTNTSSGPVRFLDLAMAHSIPGNTFEAGLDAFFLSVLETCRLAQDGQALAQLVAQLQQERSDPETAAWRRLEAQLGYDPDQAPGGLIESLSAMESRLGASAVEEAAVAAPGSRAQAILNEAVTASEASELSANLDVARNVDAVSPNSLSAWRLGEEAAIAVRRKIDVSHGAISERSFEDLIGVTWTTIETVSPTAQSLPYGARLREGEAKYKIALQTTSGVDRRFELARILGDVIWNDREAFGLVSRAKTERQKFQRAFAQSLLCPFSEVRDHIDLGAPTQEQIDSAASYFTVRPKVIETLLVINNVLPRETLAQRFEAA